MDTSLLVTALPPKDSRHLDHRNSNKSPLASLKNSPINRARSQLNLAAATSSQFNNNYSNLDMESLEDMFRKVSWRSNYIVIYIVHQVLRTFCDYCSLCFVLAIVFVVIVGGDGGAVCFVGFLGRNPRKVGGALSRV